MSDKLFFKTISKSVFKIIEVRLRQRLHPTSNVKLLTGF